MFRTTVWQSYFPSIDPAQFQPKTLVVFARAKTVPIGIQEQRTVDYEDSTLQILFVLILIATFTPFLSLQNITFFSPSFVVML